MKNKVITKQEIDSIKIGLVCRATTQNRSQRKRSQRLSRVISNPLSDDRVYWQKNRCVQHILDTTTGKLKTIIHLKPIR